MLWIHSHTSIGRHPKTRRLARLLDISIPCAVGHLHLLFHFTIEYAEDGDLSRFEAADLADAAMYEGDPQQFCVALFECGWLDADGDADDPQGCRIHDWSEYAGRFLDVREQNRIRQRERRKRQKEQASHEDVTRDILVTSRDCHAIVGGLEESRGEESTTGALSNDTSLTNDSGAESASISSENVDNSPADVDNAEVEAVSSLVALAAQTLADAPFVHDDLAAVTRQVTRSYTLVPAFDPGAGPREAELFSRWKGYRRKPPDDWYRAWLLWIKRAVEQKPKGDSDVESYADKLKRWQEGRFVEVRR